jgi:hypothetical protein
LTSPRKGCNTSLQYASILTRRIYYAAAGQYVVGVRVIVMDGINTSVYTQVEVRKVLALPDNIHPLYVFDASIKRDHI